MAQEVLRLNNRLSKHCLRREAASEGLAQTLHPSPEPDRHLPELSQPEKETVSPVLLDP